MAGGKGAQVFDTSSVTKAEAEAPMVEADPGETPGAYTWTQSLEEVVVSVGCPKGTKSNQIKCKIRPNNLSLNIIGIEDGVIFADVVLFAPVDPEESNWSIEDSIVCKESCVRNNRGRTGRIFFSIWTIGRMSHTYR